MTLCSVNININPITTQTNEQVQTIFEFFLWMILLPSARTVETDHLPTTCTYIPYSRKYWWELNLAVGSQIAITNILADLNLAVWYGIAIRIYASKKFWQILIWQSLRQSANPPNLILRQIFQLYGMNNSVTSFLSINSYLCIG